MTKKEEIQEVLNNYTIEEIMEVYLEDNCFSSIVDYLVETLQGRLIKLEKIKGIMNDE